MNCHCVVKARFIPIYFLVSTIWEGYKRKEAEISLKFWKKHWHFDNLFFCSFSDYIITMWG